jgi:bifunctional ADP-heptose synthase (sugar kinase/adenylyltransferase)
MLVPQPTAERGGDAGDEGADYPIDEVVGADLVQCYGGAVVLADLIAGHRQ